MRERLGDPRFPRAPAAAALVLVAVLSALAGGAVGGRGDSGKPAALPEAGARSVSDHRTSFLTRIVPPPPQRRGRGGAGAAAGGGGGPAGRLSLERSVAQVFLLGFEGQDATSPIFARLRRLDLGGVVLARSNYAGPGQLTTLSGEIRATARRARHLEPFVLAAQEGGDLNALGGLPPAAAASDLAEAGAAAAQAGAAGEALGPLGVSGLLAPVVDVGLGAGESIDPAIFSDDPQRVAGYAKAVVGAYRRARMFAAVKHFPGLGSASQSTEEGPATVGLSLDQLAARDLAPFRSAIAAGVPGVVVGHGMYALDDFVTPASLSRKVISGLLRRRLRFRGVAITDDLADPAITALGSVPDAAVAALDAGADMLYVSGPAAEQQAAYVAVLRAVRGREVSRRRLDEAVDRILTAKRDYGLLP